ncbi:uncharacterized protein LOC115560685 [Gadus morhua]|uniref:uncharacterized protein LOC115560685 n=1 Tax=Gadus morhua TaxID=8049 RepID=UPI0011B78A61|nr:uncharacterized protein LOC115560685 [Gadus morhua]
MRGQKSGLINNSDVSLSHGKHKNLEGTCIDKGLVQNRSKPVKKKPSCSSGRGSCPEEMHIKSQHEKCKAAQQSPEYVKVTPTEISKWRFKVQLEGEGTYECSATGLVFEVSEQALVRYSVLSWSETSELLPDSWRPAGSVYDVDVVNKDPSVLKFIHFPHSLCLAEPEHELSISVLHVKDRHADIEPTVDFTASHVKWRVSSLSPVGPIIPSRQHAKHHGAVLVYKQQDHLEQFCFHVFLAPNNKSEIKAIEEQVLSSGKKLINMHLSAACRLEEKNYQLKSKPEGKIMPSQIEFITEGTMLKGFFVAIFDQPPPFELFLMDPDINQELWTARITKGDWADKEEPKPRKITEVQSSCQKKMARLEVMPNNNPLLPDTNRGQALSSKQLMQVAETLGQEWGRVGLYLDLSTTDLDDIKEGEKDVTMQKMKMLERWQRRTPGGEATAQDLLRGLEDLKDLPVETRQLLTDMMNGSLTLPDHKANA